MQRKFRTGEGAEVVIDSADGAIDTTDLPEQAVRIGAFISLTVMLHARALENLAVEDARHEQWYAHFVDGLCVGEQKIAEWKAKIAAEAREEHLEFLTRIARFKGDVAFLRDYIETLKVKARMIEALLYTQHAAYRYGETKVPIPRSQGPTGIEMPVSPRAGVSPETDLSRAGGATSRLRDKLMAQRNEERMA